jgi:hypothetical protein
MYIESVEEIAENSGRDTVGKARLCRLMFYNGLQGKAKEWFDELEMEMQLDWALLKNAFIEKFQREKRDDRNEGYLIDQTHTLKQGN